MEFFTFRFIFDVNDFKFEEKNFNFFSLSGFENELPRLDDECIKNVIDSRKLKIKSQNMIYPEFLSLQ
jgi:hypothetical protein